jgi:hypothetical protein
MLGEHTRIFSQVTSISGVYFETQSFSSPLPVREEHFLDLGSI